MSQNLMLTATENKVGHFIVSEGELWIVLFIYYNANHLGFMATPIVWRGEWDNDHTCIHIYFHRISSCQVMSCHVQISIKGNNQHSSLHANILYSNINCLIYTMLAKLTCTFCTDPCNETMKKFWSLNHSKNVKQNNLFKNMFISCTHVGDFIKKSEII